MEVKIAQIREILALGESIVSLHIPIYQRNYDWGEDQWEQLWNDLLNCVNDDIKKYFFGNFIIQTARSKAFIIDGQQRIITISLLIKALSEIRGKNSNIEKFVKNIEESIRLNRNDETTFQKIIKIKKSNKIMKSKYNTKRKSKLYECYSFFMRKINDLKNNNPEQLFNKLINFTVSVLYIETEDKPQWIFERLNATSLRLKEADLIRNFVLMNLKPDNQEKFYNDYWKEIELHVDNIETFIRVFTMVESKKLVNKGETSKEFKKIFHGIFVNREKREEMGKNLLKSVKFYNWINQTQKHDNKKINKVLSQLKKTNLTIYYPFLLSVFAKIKDENSLLEILKIIKNFCFRWIFTKHSKGLNKLFPSLHKKIITEMNIDPNDTTIKNDKNYIDVLISILVNHFSYKFPTDKEFENKLVNENLRKNKNLRLELFKSIEYLSRSLKENVNLSIEHIMPQKLTNAWKKQLGDNWKNIHETNLEKLGNLTITDKNSQMSNKTIGDKIPIGFIGTQLEVHKYFNKKINVWGEQQIEEYARFIIDKLKKDVWPYPKIKTYKKRVKQTFDAKDEEILDLTTNDILQFKHTNIKCLYLDNKEIRFKSTQGNWTKALKETCKFLYEKAPNKFMKVRERKNINIFKLAKNKTHNQLLIPGIYINTWTDTADKIKALRDLTKELGYPQNKIKFKLIRGGEKQIPHSNSEEILDLSTNDILQFKHTNIKCLYLDNKEIEFKSAQGNWTKALKETCKFLYEKAPNEFMKVRERKNINIFKLAKNKTHNQLLIPGIYINTWTDTADKIKALRDLTKELGYPQNKIKFEIIQK